MQLHHASQCYPFDRTTKCSNWPLFLWDENKIHELMHCLILMRCSKLNYTSVNCSQQSELCTYSLSCLLSSTRLFTVVGGLVHGHLFMAAAGLVVRRPTHSFMAAACSYTIVSGCGCFLHNYAIMHCLSITRTLISLREQRAHVATYVHFPFGVT